MKKMMTLTAAALLLAACTNTQKADDPLGDSGRTLRTEHLLQHLQALGDSTVYRNLIDPRMFILFSITISFQPLIHIFSVCSQFHLASLIFLLSVLNQIYVF